MQTHRAPITAREEFRDESGTGATNRGLMMPRRKQTRTQQRANNIADQRRLNEPFGRRTHRRTQQTPTLLNAAGMLRRRDGEEMPFAGHALEFVSAAVFELEP